MRFKKRSKSRSFTVIAVPNELLDRKDIIPKVDFTEEPPSGSSIGQKNATIFDRFRNSFLKNASNGDKVCRANEKYVLFEGDFIFLQGEQRRIKEMYYLIDTERIYYENLKDIIEVINHLKLLGLSTAVLDTIDQCVQDLADVCKNVIKSEERIITYRNHFRTLLDNTNSNSSDYLHLKRLTDYVDQSLSDSRCREIDKIKNEIKLEEVASSFQPWADLQLSASNMRQISGRRKSTSALPSTLSTNGDEKMSSSDDAVNVKSGIMSRQRSHYSKKQQENFVRVYIKEGRISLSSGNQTRERYLFLFSDLLLVAKEKGLSSYGLKERIKLADVWITDEKMDQISDCVKNSQHSFVIGWPTKNYVAEFGSVDERNSWYNLLKSQIAMEKERECPNRTTITVSYKNGKKTSSCKITIDNVATAERVLNDALTAIDPPTDCRSSLQLNVHRESQQYALYGHECVFAIVLSDVRELLPPSDDPVVDFQLVEDLAASVNFKCAFYLKPRRVIKKTKTKRSGGPSQFVSQLKKRVMIKQDSQDSLALGSPMPPGGGKLFGQPLTSLVTAEDDKPPRPVLAIMEYVFKEGVFMEGIFRKPPNHKMFRDLRNKLDAGNAISLDGISPSVGASLLKEFLRYLPDSVLVSSQFSTWASLCDETDDDVRLSKAQNIISQLPAANYHLLRYLLCLLHHVKSKESLNQMNSYNLSICIGPSLINNAAAMYSANVSNDKMNTKRVVEIVQYLIENVADLFGVETLSLLGEVPEIQPHKQDSGEESDSFSNLRQETSSMDSLVASGSSPGSSRPQSGLRHPGGLAINSSRDSGLSDVHTAHDDVTVSGDQNGGNGNRGLSAANTAPTRRSMSQNETDDNYDGFIVPSNLTAQSFDNVVTATVAPSTAAAPRHLPGAGNVLGFSQSWNAGNFVVAAPDGDENASKNGVTVGANSKTTSTDSLYESLESTCSCDSMPALRHARQNSAAATLIRSESGDHLISIVEMNPAPVSASNKVAADRRRPKVASLPLTTTTTTRGDATSPDVSPDAGFGGSPRSSPSPVTAIMTRYSAVRKPARHRKGPAPGPPQVDICDNGSTVVSLSFNGDDDQEDYYRSDIENVDDEVYEAQPIVIRCNSESGESLSSIDDEDIDDRRHPVRPLSTTRMSTLPRKTTEVYSLKMPNAVVIPTAQAAYCRRASSSDIPVTAASRQQQQPTILSNLNEITQQVFSAQLQQRNLLTSRLAVAVQDGVNDSSTVTEASSEESTPHVSRESSRAQEYKRIADEMFKPACLPPTAVGRPAAFFNTSVDQARAGSSCAVGPRDAFQRSISSNDFKCRENDVGIMTYRARPVSVKSVESPKQRPPSYCEAVDATAVGQPLVKQPTVVNPTTVKCPASRLFPLTDYASPRRVSVGPCTSEGAVAAAPMAPDHKLTIPVVNGDGQSRREQRRFRRKTLGSEEYSALNEIYSQNMRANSVKPIRRNPVAPGSLSKDYCSAANNSSPADGRTAEEISWSVKQYVNFFDSGARRRPAENSRSKLPWASDDSSVCDRLGLDDALSPAHQLSFCERQTPQQRSYHASLKDTWSTGNGHVVTVGCEPTLTNDGRISRHRRSTDATGAESYV